MLAMPWFKVRRDLAQQPIVAGRIGGAMPLFAERYVYQAVERTVMPLGCTSLVTQFGGGRVREGAPDHWRSTNLPTQSLLVGKGLSTHWHYSGTVDFAVFYFLESDAGVMHGLDRVAASSTAPMPFSDPLVGAAALQIVGELQKGRGIDDGFVQRLAGVMLEQALRALTAHAAAFINPRHVHFSRLQSVLNHIHANVAGDLSAPRLAARAKVSLAHFTRIFREATGVPPHRYVQAARLEMARKLLTQSSMPISRVAEECGFSSQSHLTASFRAAHAVTPAQYRRHVGG